MHAFGFGEAAHAPKLDVDDAARVQADCLRRLVRGADALVQADGGLQLRLQYGVIDDVVVRERLLDHHQVEIVELAQVVDIGERVGGVRVRHQLDGGEALAHLPDHVHIPAGLDLHLDALVAGGEFGLDFFEELRHGILNADGDAAGDFAARAAADQLPQRQVLDARFQVPDGSFEAAARHVVAADVFGEREDIAGGRERLAEHARRHVVLQDGPRRGGPLLVIKGIFAGRDFAPSGDAVGGDFDEDDVAAVGAAEAGFEEVHQRHADLVQHNAVEFHEVHVE